MESLDQIWREYHSGLMGFIRRRVGEADLAEDILQDVFVKAHSRLDTLANADRIRGWLYQKGRKMKYSFRLAVLFCLLVSVAFAQDPLKVAPEAYKLEFENDWVKVVRVHYGPREKIPAHDHTKRAAAYVYLNDGGPVIFKHIGLEYGPITRPATKVGSFRLYKAIKEVHEVENTSDLPSDFLRVEFKTRIVDEKTLRGRFHREARPDDENYQKVQFEDEQIRVTRLVCVPGKKLDVPVSASGPALLIALSSARLNVTGPEGKAERLNLRLVPLQVLILG